MSSRIACARNPPTRRGSICGGLTAKAVRPVTARLQGFAARHFERGTNYDWCS